MNNLHIKSGGVSKNIAISYIRLIAMILIVICHFLQFYGYKLAFYLNIGVQLFFIISGYLYGNKDIDNIVPFLKKRFRKILVPYWIMALVMIPRC